MILLGAGLFCSFSIYTYFAFFGRNFFRISEYIANGYASIYNRGQVSFNRAGE